MAVLAALAVAGIAAACTPVTQPPPPTSQPTTPKSTSPVASACPGATVPVPTESNPVEYVAVVDDGDGSKEIETFTATSEAEVDGEIAELETEGEIVSVQEDLPVYAQTVNPDDPRYPEQWGLPAADFDAAWALSTSLSSGHDGSGQVIAIVDSGIATGHVEFSGRILPGQRFLGASAGTDVEDDYGHGTHVAGIAAAGDNASFGLGGAPGAQILPVKVLNSSGQGSTGDVAKGIKWAGDHGADVINLSLGGAPCSSTAMQVAIDDARAADAVVVAAAGNGNTNQLTAPAGSAGVITVGATTTSNTKAAFSNYGTYVDIGAPGVGIWSTRRFDGFGPLDGTSMSSPFVAAAAALLKQKCPALSPDAVQSRLETYAGPSISGLGAHLLDVDRALTSAC